MQTWRFNQSPDCSVCSSTQGALHTCKPKGRVTKMVTVGCGFQATICGGNKSNCVCSLPKPSVVETRHIPHGTTTKNKMWIKKKHQEWTNSWKGRAQGSVSASWGGDSLNPGQTSSLSQGQTHFYTYGQFTVAMCNVGTVTRSWSTCGEPTQRQEEHAIAY